jgi:DNA polymerase III delta prime subunit
MAFKTIRQELKHGSHVFLMTGPAGTGKAQPLDSPVLGKSGFIPMGSLKVGDLIYDFNGLLVPVLGVYPQGKKKIYKITFSDGTSTKASGNHLWRVQTNDQRNKIRPGYMVLKTKDFLTKARGSPGGNMWYIPLTAPVLFVEKKVLIDPYLLGVMIADGSLHGNFSLSLNERDIKERVSDILFSYDCHLSDRVNVCDYSIKMNHHSGAMNEKGVVYNPLRKNIDDYGLAVKSEDKFVPVDYLYNSIDIRLDILRGLFDSDGYVHGSQMIYTTVSSRLADNVAFLVRSLGGVASINEHNSFYTYKGQRKQGQNAFDVRIMLDNDLLPFTSKKHNSHFTIPQRTPYKQVKRVDYIGREECQCIYIGSQSHCYLTDDFIVTHNTTLARIMANYLKAGPMSVHEINSAENRGIDSAREIMDQMRFNPSDGESMVYILDEFHQQTKPAQEAFLKPLEDTPSHVYFFICTTNPEKLIAPLKSRCSLVVMKPLQPEEMEHLIIRTAEAEKIEISENVVARIVDIANGGSRRALKLLGKVLYLDNDKERLKALRDVGNEDEAKETIDFCRALYSGKKWDVITALMQKMDLTEPESIRYAVLGYGNAIMMKGMNEKALKVMEAFSSDTYTTGKMGLTIMAADAVLNE